MLKTIRNIFLVCLLLPAPVFAHGDVSHETLDLVDVWARKTGRRTASAAVYFTIHNNTHQQETLTGVSTDRANVAMIHRSFEESDVMRMEMQDTVQIAPGDTLSFAPGGYHVMLLDLTEPLVEGDLFALTLSFEKAGDVVVYVEVTGIAGLNSN